VEIEYRANAVARGALRASFCSPWRPDEDYSEVLYAVPIARGAIRGRASSAGCPRRCDTLRESKRR